MKAIWITLRKELLSYCFSPVSYLIAVLFYLFRGFEVTAQAGYFAYAQVDQDLFSTSCYNLSSTSFMIVLAPAILTMRCFAEERRSGSFETLMTAPVRDHEVVLGKWLAAVAFYALLWLPSVLLLWVLTWQPFLGADLAFVPVLTAYLGMFLLSGMLLAFGCLASSLTDNVLLAALLAMLFNIGLLAAPGVLYQQLQPWLENYYVAEMFQKFNVSDHFANWFARGLLDSSLIVFYLGGTGFFLFLTTLGLAARRVA